MKNGWTDMPDEMLRQIDRVRAGLDMNDKGFPSRTIQNCLTVLENDPLLKGAIRMDLLADGVAITKDLGWKRKSRGLTDDDLCHIYLYFEKFYGLTNEKNILNAIRIAANRNTFHPILDYLNTLNWDGQERIRYALKKYLGAPDDDMTYEVFKTFLMGALERLRRPGCKFEMMLCLVGGQGAGKSSFFRMLALKDEWFTDDMKKLGDEEVYLKLQGHWIVEMAEMLGTSSAKSVEEIKAFLSRQKDTYRMRYDRFSRDRPRQCVFVGTSNQQRFLPLDRTGNRRFYPVPVDMDRAEVHVLKDPAASREYMRQMWAEAVSIYKSGDFSLTVSPETEREMDKRRREYMAEDTATGFLQAWLDSKYRPFVCTSMIYSECFLGNNDPDPKAKGDINAMMNNTVRGWVKGPLHRFERYGTQRSWIPAPPEAAAAENRHQGSSQPTGIKAQETAVSQMSFIPPDPGALPF